MSASIWVECGHTVPGGKIPFKRKLFADVTYGRNDVEQIARSRDGRGVFSTVMHYINPVWKQNDFGKWLIDADQSIKAGDFYLDFDGPVSDAQGFEYVKQDLSVVLRFFDMILGIKADQIRLYFSGYKGIHLMVPMECLDVVPSPVLHRTYKMLAQKIKVHTTHHTVDTAIYDDKRMFRMVNSIHDKTNAYKVRLTKDEALNLSYEQILELARTPRPDPAVNIIVSQKAKNFIQWLQEEAEREREKRENFRGRMLDLDEAPPCIVAMHQKIFHEGVDMRNNSATTLASFYFQAGVSLEECLGILHQWAQGNCVPSLPEQEIEASVRSVYQIGMRAGCSSFKEYSGVCDKDNCPLFNRKRGEEQ